MSPFDRNRRYTRQEIHEALGGSAQAYLPTVRGAVVAGCFRRDTNPDAPSIVLPGTGSVIERTARLFASSGRAVPVFLKKAVNDWRYVGNYRVARISTDAAEIEAQARRSGRSDISCVLRLSEVE